MIQLLNKTSRHIKFQFEVLQKMFKSNIDRVRTNIYIYLGIIIVCCLFAPLGLAEQRPMIKKQNDHEIWVTIFVHGISSTRPHLNISNIWRFIKNEISDTHYKETVNTIRRKKFCHNGQAMQEIGLKKIDCTQPLNTNSACAIARLLNSIDVYRQNEYYTFGWSALIGVKERKQAAQDLYNSLITLKNNYDQQNKKIKIRIIGYSHGGNVILALGSLKKNKKKPLIIDEAITFGTPIHQEEHKWIHSALFKKIYHIYSRSDHVQRLDIFTHPGHLGHKHFRNYGSLKLPQKLMQIEIRSTRPTQGTKKNKTAFYHKPSIIMGKGKTLRNMSPGHIELWFFGWAADFYRQDLPLYPLPYIIFMPFFLHHATQLIHKNPEQPVIFDIRPYDEHMIIRQNSSYKSAQIVPFIPLSKLEQMRVLAYKAKPLDYDLKKHNKKIKKISHTVHLDRKSVV